MEKRFLGMAPLFQLLSPVAESAKVAGSLEVCNKRLGGIVSGVILPSGRSVASIPGIKLFK